VDDNSIIAYLLGAVHDGTYNQKHKTFRITQANVDWLKFLKNCLAKLGYRSWIYKEGKARGVYALETTADIFKSKLNPIVLSKNTKIAYARGYFDAEGGIPRDSGHWFYIQISQKNKSELETLKSILEELGINCGKIHIPSAKVDPDYYRFFVSRKSHKDFARIIGSWHPRKRKIFRLRMKI
jgi:intein-encoded DNA endonuclease-like protein